MNACNNEHSVTLQVPSVVMVAHLGFGLIQVPRTSTCAPTELKPAKSAFLTLAHGLVEI